MRRLPRSGCPVRFSLCWPTLQRPATGLFLGDVVSERLPLVGQVRIPLGVVGQLFRKLIICIDGLKRAYWHTRVAIDALIRMDDQEVGSLIETVHGTYFNTIGVLAVDAGFGNNVRHDSITLNGRAANPALVNSV